MDKIFIIIIIIILSFIPILLWWYIFSSLWDNSSNRKMFFIWIFSWMLSVLPILYFWDLINYLWIWFINIFEKITLISWFKSIFFLYLSIIFIILILSLLPFLVFFLKKINKQKLYFFLKNTSIFLLFWLILSFLIYFLNSIFDKITFLNIEKDFNIKFWEIVFNSIKLVILYYIIVWFIEELSKFFCFNYSSILKINNIKKRVLYSIFVALGFSFLENILYFSSLYKEYWFSKELITSYISRNIFSISLHSLCTSIFAYLFAIWYLKFEFRIEKKVIKILFLRFFLPIVLHSFFNISVTFNLGFIIFLYLIWSYFYITYIMYKK